MNVIEFNPRENLNIIDNTARVSNNTSKSVKPKIDIKISDVPFVDKRPKPSKHPAEPLKKVSDIERVCNYFVEHKQYRNLLLFVMGINFGLRISDLLLMRFGDILQADKTFKKKVILLEKKTKDTRKKKKYRICFISDAVIWAYKLYVDSLDREINLNEYLFTSESNNRTSDYYAQYAHKGTDSPISRNNVGDFLRKVINDELGIEVHAGTHLMRKTFAYHVIMNANDRQNAIEMLQKIFGHSSQLETLTYAGITDKDIEETCSKLNLGLGAMSKDICFASGINEDCGDKNLTIL